VVPVVLCLRGVVTNARSQGLWWTPTCCPNPMPVASPLLHNAAGWIDRNVHRANVVRFGAGGAGRRLRFALQVSKAKARGFKDRLRVRAHGGGAGEELLPWSSMCLEL